MASFAEIALPQLILWYDPVRIQTWPSILAKAAPDEVWPTLTHFGRLYCTERMTDDRHVADHRYIRNFPGLEQQGGRLVLRGVGMVEQVAEGYELSDYARRLAEEYVARPAETRWVKQLANILLTREPRTRVLFYCLSQPDARLTFGRKEWFRGALREAKIENGHGFKTFPFDDRRAHSSTLREVLEELSWWALGAWRQAPLLNGAVDCKWVGHAKSVFSLREIGLALRAPCEILLHLGIIRQGHDSYMLDHEAAIRELGKELAEDFGWMLPNPEKKSLLRILSEQVEILRSDTGYIVASELRGALQSHGIENPDREIAELELAGRVAIDDACQGQRRHGIGLFADPGKQLVKLRIIGGEC